MKELETAQPNVSSVEILPTPFELGTLSALRRVPGLRYLAPSTRTLRALRGGTWTMAGYGTSQLLKVASTLTLARMLAPQAFGAVALVNVFLAGLEMLSDLGIGMDVVQHPRGDDPSFINTAFIIQAVRGIALWTVAAALAYPFAHFYHQPAVLMLLVVGSFSVLLRGFTSGSVWSLTRHVQLGKYNALLAGSDLFGFIISLTWALISPTAWALVVGRVAGVAALVIASHAIAEYGVSAKWDPKAAKEILAFGSGILLSSGTYFLSGEAERLVVAKFITLVELGCLSISLSVAWACTKGLQQIISQVFFPMMSASLRENRVNAARHYHRSSRIVLLVSCCASIGFVLFSHLFVKVVLGPKYSQAGWMLQLMGVRGALELYMSVSVSMLFALGTSKFAAVGNVLKLAFMAVGLTVAFGWYGLHAALWVLMLAPIATYALLLIGLERHCKAVLRGEILGFLGFAGATAAATFLFAFFSHLWGF